MQPIFETFDEAFYALSVPEQIKTLARPLKGNHLNQSFIENLKQKIQSTHSAHFWGLIVIFADYYLKHSEQLSQDSIEWVVTREALDLMAKNMYLIHPLLNKNFTFVYACSNGYDSVVSWQLERLKQNPNCPLNPSSSNNDGIVNASSEGHPKVVKLLLDFQKQHPLSGIDPSAQGNKALKWAALKGHHQVVKLLLNFSNQNPNSHFDPTVNRHEPLRMAYFHDHLEVVKLLLSNDRVSKSLLVSDFQPLDGIPLPANTQSYVEHYIHEQYRALGMACYQFAPLGDEKRSAWQKIAESLTSKQSRINAFMQGVERASQSPAKEYIQCTLRAYEDGSLGFAGMKANAQSLLESSKKCLENDLLDRLTKALDKASLEDSGYETLKSQILGLDDKNPGTDWMQKLYRETAQPQSVLEAQHHDWDRVFQVRP